MVRKKLNTSDPGERGEESTEGMRVKVTEWRKGKREWSK